MEANLDKTTCVLTVRGHSAYVYEFRVATISFHHLPKLKLERPFSLIFMGKLDHLLVYLHRGQGVIAWGNRRLAMHHYTWPSSQFNAVDIEINFVTCQKCVVACKQGFPWSG